MNHDTTKLPQGAGATTGSSTTGSGSTGSSATGSHDGTAARTSHSQYGQAQFGQAQYSEDASGQELVLTETRGRPSTVAVVGAAIAGAVAGAAIPFMLAGRGSARTTGTSDGTDETTIHESVVIDRPARQLYDFWRNFENLPQFMDNVKSVETLDATRSHWVIKAPAGTSVEFDSRVVDDVPGRSISWESEEGASVPNRGRVEFIETASGGGTNVRVTMSYQPPAGAAGRVVAKLFQREPSVQAREDLARLKALIEGGDTTA